MPSSGSTTSRIASSRSARNSSSCAVVSLICYLLEVCASARIGFGQSIFESHPSQQGAFHPGGVFGHPGERDPVAQHVLVALNGAARGHHLGERGDGLERLADALTDHLLGEHRGRRLADGAALPVIGHVGNGFAVLGQRDPQRDLVTADRVDVEYLGAEGLAQPAVLRVLVVVQDHVLIHLLETQCHSLPKKSRARRTPVTNRSTSSAVLYT